MGQGSGEVTEAGFDEVVDDGQDDGTQDHGEPRSHRYSPYCHAESRARSGRMFGVENDHEEDGQSDPEGIYTRLSPRGGGNGPASGQGSRECTAGQAGQLSAHHVPGPGREGFGHGEDDERGGTDRCDDDEVLGVEKPEEKENHQCRQQALHNVVLPVVPKFPQHFGY